MAQADNFRRAIIGGTGLDEFDQLEILDQVECSTPYGPPSAPLTYAKLAGQPIIFLPRHGPEHHLPPHLINYRANLAALHQAGVKEIIAVNAVGGIGDSLGPGTICIPDQIIDYTYGREHTFYSGDPKQVTWTEQLSPSGLDHIDFTEPYSHSLRDKLTQSANSLGEQIVDKGVYGCTQGPRLETAAEVKRLQQDGCDLVGMTGMPEAALARELGIEYAAICLVVNWAAGISEGPITMEEIVKHLELGMGRVKEIIGEIGQEAKKPESLSGSRIT